MKILESNEKQLIERKTFFISKMNEKEEKLNEVQKKKHFEIKEKHNLLVMKEADKRENVERIMKMQEYQRVGSRILDFK